MLSILTFNVHGLAGWNLPTASVPEPPAGAARARNAGSTWSRCRATASATRPPSRTAAGCRLTSEQPAASPWRVRHRLPEPAQRGSNHSTRDTTTEAAMADAAYPRPPPAVVQGATRGAALANRVRWPVRRLRRQEGHGHRTLRLFHRNVVVTVLLRSAGEVQLDAEGRNSTSNPGCLMIWCSG